METNKISEVIRYPEVNLSADNNDDDDRGSLGVFRESVTVQKNTT